jgi:hypothetical protein
MLPSQLPETLPTASRLFIPLEWLLPIDIATTDKSIIVGTDLMLCMAVR